MLILCLLKYLRFFWFSFHPSRFVNYFSFLLSLHFFLVAGVLQIVNGTAPVVQAICAHADISAVSFVGSSKVAELVYQSCRLTNKKGFCCMMNHEYVLTNVFGSHHRLSADICISVFLKYLNLGVFQSSVLEFLLIL